MQQSPAGVHRPSSHRRHSSAGWVAAIVLLLLIAGAVVVFVLLPEPDSSSVETGSSSAQVVVLASEAPVLPAQDAPALDAPVLDAPAQEREPWSPLSSMRIIEVSPSQGSTVGGEAVVISGAGFVEGASVTFGTRVAPEVEILNAETLRVLLPPGLPGAAPVVVSAPGEAPVTAEGLFSYVDQPPRVVMAIRPMLGTTAGGSPVTIVGTGFLAGARVTIGGQRATEVEVIDSTRITALTPAHDEGLVDVVVRNPGLPASILRGAFEYVPGPTIVEVSPGELLVSGGEEITIVGSGFEPGIAVTVNGLPATGVRVLSPQELTAVAPMGVLGPATVVVAIPGQPLAELKDAVVFRPAPPLPTAPEQGSVPVPMPGESSGQPPAETAPMPDASLTPAG